MTNVSDWIPYVFVFVAGMGIGLFYYGGLWLTLSGLVNSRQPSLLVAGSFIGRLAISLGLFYWIADGRFLRIITAVAAFVIMRLLLTFIIGAKPPARGAKEHLPRSPVAEPVLRPDLSPRRKDRRSFLE